MRKFFNAFLFAFSGLVDTFKTEVNFRFHVFAMVLAIGLGRWLSITKEEWLWIFLSITLVLAFELLNTAVEAVCNQLTLEQHPLIKKAKDAAAAAVLVVSVFTGLVGFLIYFPKLVKLLFL